VFREDAQQEGTPSKGKGREVLYCNQITEEQFKAHGNQFTQE
jgi:hypothetical protein